MDNKLIKNSIYIGIFTIIIGFITEKILYKFNRKNNFLTRWKQSLPNFIVILFVIGLLINLLIEYSGFEASCTRKCDRLTNKCDYVCNVKINDIFMSQSNE
jgi:hypothetical protein